MATVSSSASTPLPKAVPQSHNANRSGCRARPPHERGRTLEDEDRRWRRVAHAPFSDGDRTRWTSARLATARTPQDGAFEIRPDIAGYRAVFGTAVIHPLALPDAIYYFVSLVLHEG